MTNQLTKTALRLRFHPFFKKCKIAFVSFSQNTIFRPPMLVVRPRPRPRIYPRMTNLTFVRGSG